MASYRFTLRTPDSAITFGTENVRNWKDIEPGLTQNDTYKFIFRKFTNTFEFTGFARQLIIQTVDSYGYDVDIFLTIEVGNDNKERWSFVQLATNLKADVQELEVGELFASLNFADNEFESLLMNSDDKKTNIDITESFNGVELPAIETKRLWCHDRTLIFNSQILTENNESSTFFISDGELTLPTTIKYKSDDNFKSLIAGRNLPEGAREFYLQSEKNRTISFDFSININMSATGTMEATRWKMVLRKTSSPATESIICQSVGYGGIYADLNDGIPDINIIESYSLDIEILEGESLELFIYFDVAGIAAFSVILNTTLDIFGTSNEYYDPTTVDCILPHELFSQFVSIYTGQQNAFYSEFFGRKELGYESDGAGAYMALLNGKMLRGFPFNECQFNTSLKEAFEALDAIFCMAGTIENIGGQYRFRIEPYKDLLTTNVIVTLGEMLSEVERRVNEKAIISEIECGYKELEFEELNGLYNFNGQFNFKTPLNIEGTKLDIVSKWIAGDVAIELTRRQSFQENPSKDFKFDKDIFIIDAKELREIINGEAVPLGVPLVARTNEGYTKIEGIYASNLAYNLNISPKRNLLRWGWLISGCLTAKQSESIIYTGGTKNPNLVTQKTDEAEIIEKSDVLVSDMDTPLMLPDVFSIAEAELTKEQWDAISDARGGMVEFQNKGVRLFGRINEITFAINRKTANFELARANY